MTAKLDEFDRNAVIAIQGGGVYGLGLLGQLSAVIDRYQIAPLALSGTSAGAIIATLFWAGLTPKEIRDRFIALAVEEPGATSSKHRETLTDLLGPFEPARKPFDFGRFRKLAGRVERFFRLFDREEPARPTLKTGWDRALWVLGMPFRAVWAGLVTTGRVLAASLHLIWIVVEVWPHLANRGLFSGERLEGAIDEWIRASPKLGAYRESLPQGVLLTFGDLRQLQRDHPADPSIYFPPLILTATNLSKRKLVLINSFDDAYADLAIGRAVRASAGFPMFFRPVSMTCRTPEGGLEEGWYVDGGVIANFPAWVFSTEFRRQMGQIEEFANLARRPWLNIGLRQLDPPNAVSNQPEGPLDFYKSLLGLLIGQVRNELERTLAARVPRSLTIEQPEAETSGPRRLLDVDQLDEDRIRVMFSRGEEFAEKRLAGLSFRLPEADGEIKIQQALSNLTRRVLRLFCQTDNGRLKFRGNIFLPSRDRLVLRYGNKMKTAPDRRMSLAFDTGLTGYCFRDRNPWICNLGLLRQAIAAQPDQSWFGMTANQHATVADDRTWLLSVPIFDPRDCWPRDPSPRTVRSEGPSVFLASTINSSMDGALLGVLNLDGAIPPQEIEEDTERMLTDPRVQSTIALAQAAAHEVSFILADAFAATKR